MIANSLPSKLGKEPLVDVVFEMRFSPSMPASVVLPGMFISQFKIAGGEKSIERLPLHDLPPEVRRQEHGMRYKPLLRVHWDNYLLVIGDGSLGVACKLPYRGWAEFRQRILTAVSVLKDSGVVGAVERIALKYVDLVPGDSIKEQVERLNIDLRVGGHVVEEEGFNVRVDVPKEHARHIINIGAPAMFRTNNNEERKGAIVDIDSLCFIQFESWDSFLAGFEEKLNYIHKENKATFFSCLTDDTINYLEPSYEQ